MHELQHLPTPPSLEHAHRASRSSRGFTIIELMVVVAILAVLTALAAPSFRLITERWRVRQAVEGLQSTLYYARSEAIKRGGNVAIQKLPNTTDCLLAVTDNDWGCGWEVFVDTDGDSTRDAGEEVLQSFSMPVNITVTRTSGGAVLNLDRWGRINGAFTGFSLVPLDKPTTDAAARGLCMGAGGRIRVINPAEIPCTAG